MNTKRLSKLVGFLKDLPEEKFYFGRVITEHENNCGTVCCAIGWTPAIFPELVSWEEDEDTVGRLVLNFNGLKTLAGFGYIASELFEMPESVSTFLFSQNSQNHIHPSLEDLPADCTPLALANILEDFIEMIEDGRVNLTHFD